MADVYAETMPDLLNIQRTGAVTRNAENPEVFTENANLIYENIPCKYRKANPYERDIVGKQNKFQLVMIDIAAIYEIQVADSGEILAKGDTQSIGIEVVGIIKKSNATKFTLVAEVV